MFKGTGETIISNIAELLLSQRKKKSPLEMFNELKKKCRYFPYGTI